MRPPLPPLRLARLLLAVLLAMASASAAPARPTAPEIEGPHLRAERTYHGVGRPLVVHVEGLEPGSSAAKSASLVLMDAHGSALLEPVPIESLTVDLARLMPKVWDLRRAAYLQLMVQREPAGPALVLQPMLSRLTLWTVRDVRPDGVTPYTRVVGWGEKPAELAAPQPGADAPPPDAPAESTSDATSDEATGHEPSDPHAPPATPDPLEVESEPVFSGLRVYPEQDVVLDTTLGSIRVALRPDEAPNTAWNFLQLARGGFYHDVPFHRIVPASRDGHPFVIQAGDPSGTGSGGPGFWLPLEPSRLPHDFGVISMARADDPDSAGGQFFIGLSREGTARLDGQYCAFGQTVEGGETILRIAGVRLADPATGRAVEPPVIREARVVPAPPREPGRGRPDRPQTRRDAEPEPEEPERVPR